MPYQFFQTKRPWRSAVCVVADHVGKQLMKFTLFKDLTVMSSKQWEQQEVVRLLKGAPGTQYQEADDANKAIIRDWVRGLLQSQPITVTFVKADGTLRDMRCTLNGDFIPTVPPKTVTVTASSASNIDGLLESVPNRKPRRQPDEHSIRVFDLDKMEWRSFRFDRLKKIVAELDFS